MSATSASEEPLRYACNRCHNLKLRCPRSSGSDEPCSRCAKVGAPCVMGKRGKVGRPAKRRAVQPSPPPEAGDAMYWDLVSVSPPVKSVLSSTATFNSAEDVPIDPALSLSDHDAQCDPDSIMLSPANPNPFGDIASAARSNSPSSFAGREGSIEDDDSTHSVPFLTPSSSMGAFPRPEPSLYESFDQNAGMFSYADITPSLLNFNAASLDSIFSTEETGLAGLEEASNQTAYGPQPPTTQPGAFNNAPRNSSAAPRQPFANTTSHPSESCLRDCLFKLSELGSRMLRSSMESQRTPSRSESSSSASSISGNMMDPSDDGTSSGHQILQDAVGFSGELIDTARQGLPRFFDANSSSTKGDGSSSGASALSQDKPFPPIENWADNNTNAASTSPLPPPNITESALIFQLIGCYTQLLYNFEVAIDCVYMEHMAAKNQSPSNINSMLKASLSVHTFTYLLGQLHKAFAACELNTYGAECSKGTTTAAAPSAHGLASPASEAGNASSRRNSVLSKDLNNGLLGCAISQIHEREETLMKKAEYLKRITSQ